MFTRFILTSAAAVLMIMLTANSQHALGDEAFSFRGLLMPGKLTAEHAKYENECEQCHGDDDSS